MGLAYKRILIGMSLIRRSFTVEYVLVMDSTLRRYALNIIELLDGLAEQH